MFAFRTFSLSLFSHFRCSPNSRAQLLNCLLVRDVIFEQSKQVSLLFKQFPAIYSVYRRLSSAQREF
jgi:hypothetical protein